MEIREKVFPRKHRDKCRQKRFRSMCSVKKAERKIYAPISRWGAQIFTGWGAQNLTVNPNN